MSLVQPDRRAAHVLRLRRVEGQVKGLQRMVDEEQPCLAVLTQLSAVTHALDALGRELVGDHVRSCLALAVVGEDVGVLTDEIMTTFVRLARS